MKTISLCALVLITGFVQAQNSPNNSNVFINADKEKLQLLSDWARAKRSTPEFLEATLANKYDARPLNSVRTFSQQMIHLTLANTGFCSTASGTPDILVITWPTWKMIQRFNRKIRVTSYVTRSYDFVFNEIKKMDAAALDQNVAMGKFSYSRLTWLMKGYEHQEQHRSQCIFYPRSLGIRPPAERLI